MSFPQKSNAPTLINVTNAPLEIESDAVWRAAPPRAPAPPPHGWPCSDRRFLAQAAPPAPRPERVPTGIAAPFRFSRQVATQTHGCRLRYGVRPRRVVCAARRLRWPALHEACAVHVVEERQNAVEEQRARILARRRSSPTSPPRRLGGVGLVTPGPCLPGPTRPLPPPTLFCARSKPRQRSRRRCRPSEPCARCGSRRPERSARRFGAT